MRAREEGRESDEKLWRRRQIDGQIDSERTGGRREKRRVERGNVRVRDGGRVREKWQREWESEREKEKERDGNLSKAEGLWQKALARFHGHRVCTPPLPRNTGESTKGYVSHSNACIPSSPSVTPSRSVTVHSPSGHYTRERKRRWERERERERDRQPPLLAAHPFVCRRLSPSRRFAVFLSRSTSMPNLVRMWSTRAMIGTQHARTRCIRESTDIASISLANQGVLGDLLKWWGVVFNFITIL